MPEYDPHDLSRREGQIMAVLYDLEEATVQEVRERLPDPPGASAVRKMLDILEEKGLARHRSEGLRHVYRPAVPRDSASRSLLRRVVDIFFDGSTEEAMVALMDVHDSELTPEALDRIQREVEMRRGEREEGR